MYVEGLNNCDNGREFLIDCVEKLTARVLLSKHVAEFMYFAVGGSQNLAFQNIACLQLRRASAGMIVEFS
jgi:hypothetical protein